MKKSPSLQQIALAAGVAKSTASLALRDDPRISESERLRIRALADKMGYKPNLAMARLMTEFCAARRQKYAGTLALVNCSSDNQILKHNRVAAMVYKGVKKRGEQMGYSIDTFWLKDPELNARSLANIMRARNIQGVMFHNMESNNDVIEFDLKGVVWNCFPSIAIGRKLTSPPLTFASNDHYATLYQLGVKLRQLGYKKTGVVISKQIDEGLEERFIFGFFSSQAHSRNGIPPLYISAPSSESSARETRQTLDKWLGHHQPDSCICLSRYVYDWILELGIRVPEDLGVAFIDLNEDTKGMAGMNQNQPEIGMAAVDTLIGRILSREKELPPFQYGVTIESEWQMGSSLRVIR